MDALRRRPSREALVRAWCDPGAFATTLVALLADRFGEEGVRQWDPETIRLEVRDLLGRDLPGPNLDRLLAGVAIERDPGPFYTQAAAFVQLASVLNGGRLAADVLDLPDAAECAWAITEVFLLSPPDPDDETPFSDEVVAYVGQVVRREGLLYPPDVLRIAGDHERVAARVQYEFSDDPTMFEAMDGVARGKADDIRAEVKERVLALFDQLARAPLENGDASGLAERAAKRFNR